MFKSPLLKIRKSNTKVHQLFMDFKKPTIHLRGKHEIQKEIVTLIKTYIHN